MNEPLQVKEEIKRVFRCPFGDYDGRGRYEVERHLWMRHNLTPAEAKEKMAAAGPEMKYQVSLVRYEAVGSRYEAGVKGTK